MVSLGVNLITPNSRGVSEAKYIHKVRGLSEYSKPFFGNNK